MLQVYVFLLAIIGFRNTQETLRAQKPMYLCNPFTNLQPAAGQLILHTRAFWASLYSMVKCLLTQRTLLLVFVFLLSICKSPVALAQSVDTLRLMHYNLTNYGHNAFSCNATTNNIAKKDSLLRIILAHAQPDMLGVNEVKSLAAYAQRIVQLNLNINGATTWAAATPNFTRGSDLMNLFFYNSAKVGLKEQFTINSSVRLMDHYRMYVMPKPGQADTTFFNVILSHLKAGNTSQDRAVREGQINTLNTYLSTKDTAEGFIYQGDFNVYNSAEVNYQMVVNSAQGGRFIDPISRPGVWTNNPAFADVHTQCPSVPTGGCFSGGGLDDRFDQQVVTRGLLAPGRPLQYVGSAFRVIGNDGRHFNQDITNGTNTSAPPNVINALWSLSDHLPIQGKLLVTTPLTSTATLSKTAHSVWLGPDGLHIQGLQGPALVRISTLTGTTLLQTTSSTENTAVVLPQVSAQWMLVTLQPVSGSKPSQHRVWISN